MKTVALALVTVLTTTGVAPGQQAADPDPGFAVVSIKKSDSLQPGTSRVWPGGRYTLTNLPVIVLVTSAYGLPVERVIGAPAWLQQDRYEIDARAEGIESLAPALRMRMQQHLLRERFNFRARVEQRSLPVYALVEARPGSAQARLKRTTVDCSDAAAAQQARAKVPAGTPVCATQFLAKGDVESIAGTGVAMERLVRALASAVERPVLDRTNLTGAFDVTLEWTSATAPSGPQVSIFTALQEQLGLRLESTQAPLDVLVIEQVERPTDN